MKRLFIICLLIFTIVGCSSEQPTFHDNHGKKIQFSKLHGKWIIINYWASWCHSCVKEIPQLNSFYQHHKNNVIVLGVNYDLITGEALKKAIKKLHIIYPVLTADPRNVLHLKDPGIIPITYVINPQGQCVRRLLGPQTEKKLNKVMSLQ